jgi:hypothetical protein
LKGLVRRVATRLLYSLLPRLLAAWPWVTYRPYGLLLGTVRWLAQAGPRRAAGPVLRALGRPATPWARWRFAWQTAYHIEAAFVLSMQTGKMSDDWIARHVRCDAPPPPGGAILVGPHQEYGRLANLYLRQHGYNVGILADAKRETWDADHPDHAGQLAAHGDRGEFYARRWRTLTRLYDGHVFRSPEETRAALRFLNEGGYLVIKPEGYRHAARERWGLEARHSGKPIVPFVVIPDRRGWRVMIGDPVAPTQSGVAAALTTCLRATPATMHGLRWQAWSRSPAWDATSSTTGEREERGAGEDAR